MSRAILVVITGFVVFAGILLYYGIQPSNIGKTYVLQAQQEERASRVEQCADVLYQCVNRKDPCPDIDIPCTWRLGPSSSKWEYQSGCFKTCISNGKATLKVCT